MTEPTFYRPSDLSTDPSGIRVGGGDWKYVVDVLDATHATDRIQASVIEGLIQNYDAVIYISGSTVYARRANGSVLASGDASSTNLSTVFQAALDVNGTTGTTPTIVLVRPGTYQVGNPRPTAHSNTTIIGYGATIKETVNLASPLQTDAAVQNWRLLGLTFDFNKIGAPVFCRGDNTNGGCKNIHAQDCTFLQPMNRSITGDSNRTFLVTYTFPLAVSHGGPGGQPAFMNEKLRILNCEFDCFVEELEGGGAATQSVCQFANTRDVLVEGCNFYNATLRVNASLSCFNNNRDVIISNNRFFNGRVQDINVTQNTNVTIIGNKCGNNIEMADVRYVDIVGNRAKWISIEDLDQPTHDSFDSLYRGSEHVAIIGNILNSAPPPSTGAQQLVNDETTVDFCVFIDIDANITNPPKYISIIGNEGRYRRNFIRGGTPPAGMTAPVTGVYILNNTITEQSTDTAASQTSNSAIFIRNLTGIPSEGYDRIVIDGNIMVPTTSPQTQFDVEFAGTGFTNVVVRNNTFANKGVSNINSYPNVKDNFNFATAANRKEMNSGTATITSGAAPRSVTVNHDLCFTPTADNIMVVGTNNPTNDPGRVWTSGYTATQFTLNCKNDPGSSATFAWWARRI